MLNRVYFYTSSIEKYLQARFLFDRHGLTVDYSRTNTDPYDEDYSGTTEQLLAQAIAQVADQVGIGRLVFVEDTSVRIDALSEGNSDFPGMRVKHWFSETSFAACDKALVDAGGDRRATVNSDIALKIPRLGRPVFVHGETTGIIASAPPDFLASTQYPWLTPDTFNGWFIPDGTDLPLGALPIEDSLRFDFRVKAFEALIDRLEEYAFALNLPPTAYRRRRPLPPISSRQASLFSVGHDGELGPAIAVVGRTCAGKTTFAEYASGRHRLRHIEASTIVRSLPVASHTADDADGFTFAMRALDELGHDVVVNTLIEQYGDQLLEGFVVSGLRDILEIHKIREMIPGIKVVLIEASERTRYERHVKRARTCAKSSLKDFRSMDRSQDAFGFLTVAEDLSDVLIHNEGKLEEYHRQIDAIVMDRRHIGGVDFDLQPRAQLDQHQLYRCLRILQELDRPLQCDEIEAESIQGGGSRIRHNNANKVLRRVPVLARRFDPPSSHGVEDVDRVRYAITGSGVAYIALMDARRSGPQSGNGGSHA